MYENLLLLTTFFMSIAILFYIGAMIILWLMFHELREVRRALDLLAYHRDDGVKKSEKNQ